MYNFPCIYMFCVLHSAYNQEPKQIVECSRGVEMFSQWNDAKINGKYGKPLNLYIDAMHNMIATKLFSS